MKFLFVILLLSSTLSAFTAEANSTRDTTLIADELQSVLRDCRRDRNEASCLRSGIRSVISGIEFNDSEVLACASVNAYGKSAQGGGCNFYGCYYPGGDCNFYGCYYEGGGCNFYGCTKQAPKTTKACID